MANFSMEHSRTISALERIANALELQALCQVAKAVSGQSNITYGVLIDRAQDILHPVKCKGVAGNTPYRGDQ